MSHPKSFTRLILVLRKLTINQRLTIGNILITIAVILSGYHAVLSHQHEMAEFASRLNNQELIDLVKHGHRYLLIELLPLVILIFFVNYIISKSILRPIFLVAKAILDIIEQGYISRLPVSTNDEIDRLALVINRLLDKINRDITTIKEKDHHLRMLVNSAIDAIITINHEGQVIDYNEAAVSLFGFTYQEVYGKKIADLIIPKYHRRGHEKAIREAMGKGRQANDPIKRRVELSAICKNGQRVEIELSIVSSVKQGEIYFTAYIRDITEKKQLLRTLEESLQVAEASNNAKSKFLSNMSHEIRTPMNAIIGMTELVMQSELTQDQKKHLSIVARSSQNLLELINQILDLSKIKAGLFQVERVPFDLLGRMEGICESLALKAHSKNLELNLYFTQDPPPTLMGDPIRLRQVLTNLIGNAIKFTESGEIRVTLKPVVQQSSEDSCQILFSVADTGIGIEKKAQDSIFNRFTQADGSTTRKHGGTGLGLAISKSIVSLMGGELEFASEPNQGSVFFFSLVFKRVERKEGNLSDQDERRQVRATSSALSGVKVLTAIPSVTNRAIISSNLVLFGASVTELNRASDIKKILSQAHSKGNSIDTLIIDASIIAGVNSIDDLIPSEIPSQNTILLVPVTWSRLALYGNFSRVNVIEITKPAKRYSILRALNWFMGKTATLVELSTRDLQDIKSKMRPANILLVEDISDNQIVATTILESAGQTITIANNGQEAIQLLTSSSFDLVIMDLQMPVMDGFEATKLIRSNANAAIANIPIIACSAHAFCEQIEVAYSAGVNAYLTKPYLPVEFLKAVEPYVAKNPPQKAKKKKKMPVILALPEISQEEQRSLIAGFKKTIPQELTLLKDLVIAKQSTDVLRHADIIKRQAASLGANALKLTAIDIKSKADISAWQEVAALIEKLESQINIVLKKIGEADV